MAVINPYSSAVAAVFAENAVATRQDRRVMREADVARQVNEIERRMVHEKAASSQRQTELTTSIVKGSASAVQNGLKAGQKIADLGEHGQINTDLKKGAGHYQRDQGAALLETDLGNGHTVEDVLGTDSEGRRVENPQQRQVVAQAKLHALMTGDTSSAKELHQLGFSRDDAEGLAKAKARHGGALKTEDAVRFLYERSAAYQQNQARDEVHDTIDKLINHAVFAASEGASKIGAGVVKEAARSAEEGRANAQRDRGTLAGVSRLVTEQLNGAAQMVLNKRDQSYPA